MEATTRDCKHWKEEILVSKDWKAVKRIEKELSKCAMLDKKVAKKLFDERWSTKCYVEQGNALQCYN
jgi:hypothetical protein